MKAGKGLVSRRKFCATGAALATFGFTRLATAAEPESGKTITQIAKFKLNMENEQKAIQALKDLCAAVQEKEPGVLIYICHRNAKHPEEIVFFEMYKDEDALKAHGKTPHFGKLRSGIGPLFRMPIEVTKLDRVGGFARATT